MARFAAHAIRDREAGATALHGHVVRVTSQARVVRACVADTEPRRYRFPLLAAQCAVGLRVFVRMRPGDELVEPHIVTARRNDGAVANRRRASRNAKVLTVGLVGQRR